MASPTDPAPVGVPLDPLSIRDAPPQRLALLEAGRHVSYGELVALVDRDAATLADLPAGVALVAMSPTVDAITAYLACLSSGRPVVLVDDDPASPLPAVLIERYSATATHGVRSGTFGWSPTDAPPENGLPPQVLLTTSGSTGSPKLVRLPHRAIRANATSIVASLGIGPDERAPSSLPLFYSYGLSVLNSHLLAGAALALTTHGVITREFWTTFDGTGCTSFAGVPYTYAMLKRLRFDPAAHPTLRTLTQAGGKLDVGLRQHFHASMAEVGGRFVVMYGQTEATARLSVLAHDDFVGRERSVGRAIPGGRFVIETEDGETDEPGVEGEVVYYGDNVMDGYAESLADLRSGDQLDRRLRTGDRGLLDADGFMWLVGRLKRIAKIFGTRVNLDDIEELMAALGLTGAAISIDDGIVLAVEGHEHNATAISRDIAQQLRVHRSGVRVHHVDGLPLLPNGKVDYRALEAALGPSNAP